MSEMRTAAGNEIARVEQVTARGMITLKGDLSEAWMKNAATGVTGVDMPGPLSCAFVQERGIGWMAPDEVLIFLPHAEVAQTILTLQDNLAGRLATVVDVSDARALFRLTGPHAREVLAKLTPADMAPAAFPAGSFRRTRLAQVPVAIWAEGDGSFGLICFRSVAVYVHDLLRHAACPGAAVGYFPVGG